MSWPPALGFIAVKGDSNHPQFVEAMDKMAPLAENPVVAAVLAPFLPMQVLQGVMPMLGGVVGIPAGILPMLEMDKETKAATEQGGKISQERLLNENKSKILVQRYDKHQNWTDGFIRTSLTNRKLATDAAFGQLAFLAQALAQVKSPDKYLTANDEPALFKLIRDTKDAFEKLQSLCGVVYQQYTDEAADLVKYEGDDVSYQHELQARGDEMQAEIDGVEGRRKNYEKSLVEKKQRFQVAENELKQAADQANSFGAGVADFFGVHTARDKVNSNLSHVNEMAWDIKRTCKKIDTLQELYDIEWSYLQFLRSWKIGFQQFYGMASELYNKTIDLRNQSNEFTYQMKALEYHIETPGLHSNRDRGLQHIMQMVEADVQGYERMPFWKEQIYLSIQKSLGEEKLHELQRDRGLIELPKELMLTDIKAKL
ncbi:hypothetical protein MBLNU459_g1991t1 [Dothideomycetes sp. NU459]